MQATHIMTLRRTEHRSTASGYISVSIYGDEKNTPAEFELCRIIGVLGEILSIAIYDTIKTKLFFNACIHSAYDI